MKVRDLLLWSRDVARWFRCSLSVSDPFVCRCLTSLTMLPFPHPPGGRGGRPSRLPQNVVCRFPALRSSAKSYGLYNYGGASKPWNNRQVCGLRRPKRRGLVQRRRIGLRLPCTAQTSGAKVQMNFSDKLVNPYNKQS